MNRLLSLITAIFFIPTYLLSEIAIIYADQSAQYSATDCCTPNTIINQNGNLLYSQDCRDMGAYYGCGMLKQVPFWIFNLSTLNSSIDIQSIQLKGNLPTEDWSNVYLSASTTTGQISTTIASNLWNGNNWTSGSGQYSSINWLMGDFNQNLPLELISEGVISGQLNILTYTSNAWTVFSIVNSGENSPRLVIEYESEIVPILGDVNSDNIVNVLDIIEIVNLILNNNEIYIELADMNFDSQINVFDIIHITKLI